MDKFFLQCRAQDGGKRGILKKGEGKKGEERLKEFLRKGNEARAM
jgi:hypothetical protein